MTQDFWTRRKAQVAEEAQIDAAPEIETVDPELSDAEVLAAFDLPDPDLLVAGDDIKGFMAKAVPDHLRRRALRKLWRLNPVLANVDGLVDYGQDFTDNAMVVEGLQTAYQVGKGMLSHLEKLAAPEIEDVADDIAEVDDAPTLPIQVDAVAPVPAEIETETSAPARRRMRFDIPHEASA
jgi:hypothetical protein